MMPQLRLLLMLFLGAFVAVKDNEGNGRDTAQQASQAMREGRFEDASRLYQTLKSRFPRDSNLRLSLATALFQAKHYSETLQELESVRVSETHNPKFWWLLGETELKLGDEKKAAAPLERAVELDAANDELRLELAATQLELQQLAAAERQYEILWKKSPKSPAVLKGLVLSQLGMSNQALAALKTEAPHSSYLYGLAAAAASESGDTERAAKLFQQALEKPPEAAWMRLELAAIEQHHPLSACDGNTVACRFFKGEARLLAPEVSSSRTSASLYWTTRVYSELGRQSMEALSALPPCAEQHEMMANLYTQNGRRSEAIAELREAAKMNPEDQLIKGDLAEALWADRQFDEAISLLSGLIELSRDHAGWQFELGDALFNTGKLNDGMIHLRNAVALAPDLLAAHAKLGEALLRSGDPAAALPHLRKAETADQDGSIHFQLAAAYRKLGRPQEAAKAMERQKELAALKAKAAQ